MAVGRAHPSRAARARAVALLVEPRHERDAAARAVDRLADDPVLARAVRVERRRAVRAEDPQVLEPVVVADAVDVVEDQRHPAAAPLLVLAAELAALRPEAGVEEPLLELGAVVAAVLDEDPLERDRRARSPPRTLAQHVARVEVGGRDAPLSRVLPEGREVAAGRAQAERAERLRHRAGTRDGGLELSAGEGAGHEHMFAPPRAYARARRCSLGGPDSNQDLTGPKPAVRPLHHPPVNRHAEPETRLKSGVLEPILRCAACPLPPSSSSPPARAPGCARRFRRCSTRSAAGR